MPDVIKNLARRAQANGKTCTDEQTSSGRAGKESRCPCTRSEPFSVRIQQTVSGNRDFTVWKGSALTITQAKRSRIECFKEKLKEFRGSAFSCERKGQRNLEIENCTKLDARVICNHPTRLIRKQEKSVKFNLGTLRNKKYASKCNWWITGDEIS